MLPAEMKLMTSLHELVVQDMPRFFVRRLQDVDLQKVQHIPLIRYM